MAEEKKVNKAKKLPRHPMPEQEAKVRARNFEEVPFGYSNETAMLEASRCLRCKKPKCVEGCPVNVKIPEFVGLIADGDFIGAAHKLKETILEQHRFQGVQGEFSVDAYGDPQRKRFLVTVQNGRFRVARNLP